MLILHLASVIICQLDVISVAFYEPEANSPLVIYRDGMLSRSIPLEFMKSVAWGNLQVVHANRQIEICQPSQRPFPDFWRKPLRFARLVQLLRVPVGKRLDHVLSVNCHVTLVNRS